MEITGRSRAVLTCAASVEPASADGIRRALGTAGLSILSDDDRSDGAAAILAVPYVSDETIEAVQRAGRTATTRILVVTLEIPDERAAWRLLQSGAADVIVWNDAATSAECVAARLRHWNDVDAIVGSSRVRQQLVGQSRPWLAAIRELVEVARLPDIPVLITGESGTGKELAARLLHDIDPRPQKSTLVVVDCASIVPTLSGSEFFGHERGAFTDAVATRDGAFSEANGGTLFLDEIGELPLRLQAELLRVVQEGTYKRIGSGVWRRTAFRLVCATNRDLREEVNHGNFRADLYHRLAAWTIRLPSLAERPDDIARLARHFLRQSRPDDRAADIDPAVVHVLEQRAYPGNVRELRQLVARIAGRHVGPGPITVGDLPDEERPADDGENGPRFDAPLVQWVRQAVGKNVALRDIRKVAEDTAIAIAYEEAGGNLHAASQRLRVTDRALQMRRAAARKNGGGSPPDR